MTRQVTMKSIMKIVELYSRRKLLPYGFEGRCRKYVVKDPTTGEIGLHIVIDRVNRIIHLHAGPKRPALLMDMDTAYVFDDLEAIQACLEEWVVNRTVTRLPGYAYATITEKRLRKIGEDLKAVGLIKDHHSAENEYTYTLKSGVQLSIIGFGQENCLAVARNEHGGVIEGTTLAAKYYEVARFIPWWVEQNSQSLFELSLRDASAVDIESAFARQLENGNATLITDGGDGGYKIRREDGQILRIFEFRHPTQDPVFMLRWYARHDTAIMYKTQLYAFNDWPAAYNDINSWLENNGQEDKEK